MTEEPAGTTPRRFGYVLVAFGLVAMVVAAYIGIRFANRAGHRLPPPRPTPDVSAIQDWMTIPYVARAYDVPPLSLFEAAGADVDRDGELSLRQIAEQQNRDVEVVVDAVRLAVTALQSPRPPPR